MQLTSLTLPLAALVLSVSAFGCAASDTSGIDPGEGVDSGAKGDTGFGADTGGSVDTGSGGSDTGSGGTDTTPPDSGATCISSCTTDDECATTCPAAGSGSNCCDTATGVCYVSADSTCPATGPTDTGPTPPY